jgi:hypothetical protein
MNKSFAGAVILAFALGMFAGAMTLFAAKRAPDGVSSVHPRWTETRWPFPLDQWGPGRAFRCAAADCGTEVQLYLRSKSGFCNCATGITDDDELDRVSDAELFGPDLVPHAAGRAITVGGLNGRSRSFSGAQTSKPGQVLWTAAFHDRCDAIVVTALAAERELDRIVPAVIAFLDGRLAPPTTPVASAGR